MDESRRTWEQAGSAWEWLVPWKHLNRDARWFVGGYSNVALNVVDRHLEMRADVAAVIDRRGDSDRRMTYRDLYWQSAQLARWLSQRGVTAGTRIGIYGPPAVEGLAVWLAACRLGAVVVRFLAATDSILAERLRTCEVEWMAVTAEAAEQMRRVQRQATSRVQTLVCGAAAGPGETGYLEALDGADGLLDPIALEANTVGLLIYGDVGEPFAYSALGSVMGWQQSLSSLLELSAGDRVGIKSPSGGLWDLYVLSLAVLAAGATTVWVDDDWMSAVRTQGLTKAIVWTSGAHKLQDAAERLEGILVVGPERPAVKLEASRAWVHRAFMDMQTGLYTGPDGYPSLTRGISPAADRTASRRASPMVPPDLKVPQEVQAVIDRVTAMPGVREAVPVANAAGHWDLWVEGNTTFSLDPAADEASAPSPRVRLLRVAELPETVEGYPAIDVLSAISRGDARIALGALRNPETVEGLVRALHLRLGRGSEGDRPMESDI